MQDDDAGERQPAAGGPAAPAQPGAAGLDHLLPARRVASDVRLPATSITWRRVVGWLRRKHPNANWKWLRRRYLRRQVVADATDEVVLFNPSGDGHRYRYRGTTIPSPWHGKTEDTSHAQRHGLVESRMRGNAHVRFGGRDEETGREQSRNRASCRPHHDVYLMDKTGENSAPGGCPRAWPESGDCTS